MTTRRPIALVAVAAALAACGSVMAARANTTPHSAAAAAAGARLVTIGNFDQPIVVTGAPGDPSRVFVAQRTGQIILMRNGHRQARPFLDVASR